MPSHFAGVVATFQRIPPDRETAPLVLGLILAVTQHCGWLLRRPLLLLTDILLQPIRKTSVSGRTIPRKPRLYVFSYGALTRLGHAAAPEFTHRADIEAVDVVLYETLCIGRELEATKELLQAHVSRQPFETVDDIVNCFSGAEELCEIEASARLMQLAPENTGGSVCPRIEPPANGAWSTGHDGNLADDDEAVNDEFFWPLRLLDVAIRHRRTAPLWRQQAACGKVAAGEQNHPVAAQAR